MELRGGDRIRWTLNDAGLGLVNSQTTEVTAVTGGRVSFRLEDGRMLDMNAGDPQLRHIDRAWASTVHAFQGRTVDNVIAAIEANHRNLTNPTVTVAVSLVAGLAGPSAIAFCAVAMGVPVWIAWYRLVRRG